MKNCFYLNPNDTTGDHYGISQNGLGQVLVQIQSTIGPLCDQARIMLTINQAEHMIQLLQENIELAKQAELDLYK